jgi:hypothetical protein
MLLKHLISIVLVSFTITGLAVFYAEIADNYDVESDYNYTQYDQLLNLKSDATTVEEEIRGTGGGGGLESQNKQDTIMQGAFNSINLVWNSWSSVSAMATYTMNSLQIPRPVFTVFSIIFLLVVSFGVIRGIMRFNV